MSNEPRPQLPAPESPKGSTAAGKAHALAEKSNQFYENHWVEICLAIVLLSLFVVWITPN